MFLEQEQSDRSERPEEDEKNKEPSVEVRR